MRTLKIAALVLGTAWLSSATRNLNNHETNIVEAGHVQQPAGTDTVLEVDADGAKHLVILTATPFICVEKYEQRRDKFTDQFCIINFEQANRMTRVIRNVWKDNGAHYGQKHCPYPKLVPLDMCRGHKHGHLLKLCRHLSDDNTRVSFKDHVNLPVACFRKTDIKGTSKTVDVDKFEIVQFTNPTACNQAVFHSTESQQHDLQERNPDEEAKLSDFYSKKGKKVQKAVPQVVEQKMVEPEKKTEDAEHAPEEMVEPETKAKTAEQALEEMVEEVKPGADDEIEDEVDEEEEEDSSFGTLLNRWKMAEKEATES